MYLHGKHCQFRGIEVGNTYDQDRKGMFESVKDENQVIEEIAK